MGPPTSGAFNLECVLTPLLGDPVTTQRTQHTAPQRGDHPSPASQAPNVSPAHLSSPPLAPCSVPTPASASPLSLPPHPPSQHAGPCRAGFDPRDFCGDSDAEPHRASCRLSPLPSLPRGFSTPSPVSCGCISGWTGLVRLLF